MYCPPGFIDGEDGGGNVVLGNWREEESTGLTSISQVSSNRLNLVFCYMNVDMF